MLKQHSSDIEMDIHYLREWTMQEVQQGPLAYYAITFLP